MPFKKLGEQRPFIIIIIRIRPEARGPQGALGGLIIKVKTLGILSLPMHSYALEGEKGPRVV